MVQNRLAKAQILKKLTELKKANNFPVKPSLNPAVLYVEDVLNPQNLTWDHPNRRGHNLNETIRRAVQAWPSMDPKIKSELSTIFTESSCCIIKFKCGATSKEHINFLFILQMCLKRRQLN